MCVYLSNLKVTRVFFRIRQLCTDKHTDELELSTEFRKMASNPDVLIQIRELGHGLIVLDKLNLL